jgi:integrase
MLIRTGVRTKEVQRARFNEFDLDTMTWKVPGFDEDGTRRTKNGEDHYLPITRGIAAIYQEMRKISIDPSPNAFMFPGIRQRQRSGQPISPLSMQSFTRVLRNYLKLDVKIVNHGFRSTLRGWCSANKYPDEWWKIQVGQTIGDKTSQAYPFGEQFEGRREMMQRYDDHCSKPTPEPKADNIVTLTKRRTA